MKHSKSLKKISKRNKSKRNKSKRNKSKRNKSKRNKSKYMRKKKTLLSGGYGKGTNPLIGNAWNVDSGYFYKHSPDGVGVGGQEPYYGTGSPMPQHGGSIIPNFLLNPINGISNNLGNLSNMYKGVRPINSSYPWNQKLQPK